MADERSASMLELRTVEVPQGSYDVAILGGGLAGLTMAIHLKRDRPETRVLVVDRRSEPAPEAAFKVGESSVEIGAHYRDVVGMRDHLEQQQIRKLGLRFFWPATTATSPSASSSARPAIWTRSRIRSIAAGSRTSCSGGPARPAPTPIVAGGSPTLSWATTRARSR